MSRHINIVRAGSVCNNIEQIKEIYSNHAKLIQELLAKTSTVDTLNKEVNTLKEKQTVPSEELKSLQDELETLKKAMTEIESLRNEISTLKSDDKSDVKQELLNVLNNSIPKFAIEQDEKSDDGLTSRVSLQCDFPYDVPESDDGTDGWTINGIEFLPTIKDNQRICSIKTDYGGIAIDKTGSEDRWIIERNIDDELNLHFNSDGNIPLSVLRDGISTPKLMIGDKNITSIATVINNDTISSKSIPTTKALVDYVNANILKVNIENVIDGTNKGGVSNSPTINGNSNAGVSNSPTINENSNIGTSNDNSVVPIINTNSNIGTSNVTNQPPSTLPSCDVSTIEINGLKSLLVDNDSSSFSVKHNGTIVTLKPSVQDGLMINDLYKLSNDSGILCIMNDKSLESLEDPTDIIGRYVEYTGKVIEINDILALEVQIPSDVSSVICGIIGKDLKLQDTFTHGNKIYKLPEHDKDSNETKLHFVTLFNSGIHYIKTIPGEYVRGSLLVPSKGGFAKQSSVKIANFCIEHMIPRAKVITKINDKIVAMLV